MIRLLTPPLVALVVAASGCSGSSPAMRAESRAWDGDDGGARGMAYDAPVAASEAAPAAADGFSFFGGGASKEEAMAQPPPPPQDPKAPPLPTGDPADKGLVEAAKRLVIYTGSMSLMVPIAADAADAFVEKVNGLGGYLQQRSATTVTVRVPAGQFFAVLEGLRKTGTVTDEQVNAQDVTKKVFDTELRLQTADESRKRLVEILKSATKIEDILRIETEIRRLTDEIEAMKGELRNLGDQIAFSTLTVSFYANAPAPRPYPDRTQSRFDWINQIGVEQVLYGF